MMSLQKAASRFLRLCRASILLASSSSSPSTGEGKHYLRWIRGAKHTQAEPRSRLPMLWLSSSWSIKTWSRTKLSSSFCRVPSGLKTRGWRPSLPPETSWWLKIISKSQRSMNAWKKSHKQCQMHAVTVYSFLVCLLETEKDLDHHDTVAAAAGVFVPVLWLVCWRLKDTAGIQPGRTSPLSSEPRGHPAGTQKHNGNISHTHTPAKQNQYQTAAVRINVCASVTNSKSHHQTTRGGEGGRKSMQGKRPSIGRKRTKGNCKVSYWLWFKMIFSVYYFPKKRLFISGADTWQSLDMDSFKSPCWGRPLWSSPAARGWSSGSTAEPGRLSAPAWSPARCLPSVTGSNSQIDPIWSGHEHWDRRTEGNTLDSSIWR